MFSVFNHHIYEYQKGLRHLVLHTMRVQDQSSAERKLRERNICYLIWPLGKDKINIFFGSCECIAVLKLFGKSHLSELSREEDFILGTMLGYDRLLQCERYILKKNRERSACAEQVSFH